MLYTAACAFSFRAPSEGLPLCVYRPEMGPQPDHAVIVSQSSAVVALRRRKNLIQGNTITRSCTCCECTPPCQVHVLGRWLSSLSAGPRPWADGRLLSLSGSCKHAWLVSARALQRSTGCMTSGAGGGAQDLLANGARFVYVLRAGQWRSRLSPATWTKDLDRAAAVEAHLSMSSCCCGGSCSSSCC